MQTLGSGGGGVFPRLVAVLAVVMVIVGGQAVSGLGCRSLGFCCQGKNNTCRPTRLDNIREDTLQQEPLQSDEHQADKSKTCFCDSACLDLGDCCDDYKHYCKPVDCVVAAKWSEWGACEARCGPGVKQRTRRIVRAPMNGGKPCDPIIEKIACEGVNCKVARAPEGLEQLSETGKIIPASYGPWRKSKVYDPFKDIRKNLFDHYRTKSLVNRPPYCVTFEMTEVQPSCNSTVDQWAGVLKRGSEVCVECQTMAMHKQLGGRCVGQGVKLRETRWNAVLVPGCHGKWVMQTRKEDCRCDKDSPSSFILL